MVLHLDRLINWLRQAIVWKPASLPSFVNHEVAEQHVGSYENNAIVDIVVEKTKQFTGTVTNSEGTTPESEQTRESIAILERIWRETGSVRPLGIVDLGGACGAWYYELNQYIPHIIGQWHVVETPAFAASGTDLFESYELKFFENLHTAAEKLDNCDVIMAQGVIQYLAFPLLSLADLFTADASYVYLTRTVVATNISEQVITVHETSLLDHGPGAAPQGVEDSLVTTPITLLPLLSVTDVMRSGGEILEESTSVFETWQVVDQQVDLVNLTVLVKATK